MTLCILGLPSRTTDAVAHLCRLSPSISVSQVLLDDGASTDAFLAHSPFDESLIVSHFPRKSLVDWLRATRTPTIVVAPDLYVCLAHAEKLTQNNRGLLPGVLSQSLSLLASAIDLPVIALITGYRIDSELRALFSLLEWTTEVSTAAISAAERSIISSLYEVAPGEGSEGDVSAVSREPFTDTTKACQGLLDLVRRRPMSEINWPVALFFDTITRARPAPPELDLTGPARCLYFGPYLHLPVGSWDAILTVGILGKSGTTELRAELYTDSDQVSYPCDIPTNGTYEVRFKFEVRDATQAIQIRLFVDRGEIEGTLQFEGARLTPAVSLPAKVSVVS